MNLLDAVRLACAPVITSVAPPMATWPKNCSPSAELPAARRVGRSRSGTQCRHGSGPETNSQNGAKSWNAAFRIEIVGRRAIHVRRESDGIAGAPVLDAGEDGGELELAAARCAV